MADSEGSHLEPQPSRTYSSRGEEEDEEVSTDTHTAGVETSGSAGELGPSAAEMSTPQPVTSPVQEHETRSLTGAANVDYPSRLPEEYKSAAAKPIDEDARSIRSEQASESEFDDVSLSKAPSTQDVPGLARAVSHASTMDDSSAASPRPSTSSLTRTHTATQSHRSSLSVTNTRQSNAGVSSDPSIYTNDRHSRKSSTATVTSTATANVMLTPHLSSALILPGLESIANSKEAKRDPALQTAATRAMDLCRQNQASEHPFDILEPLRLACETHHEKLVIPSLDLVSKLTSHGFFRDSDPNSSRTNQQQPALSDLIAHTITSCYTEASTPAVALQVVKALLSLVLSSTILVHQSSLLKAVRTVYNVFLLSPDVTNQTVAQGALTQMVNHIFNRIRIPRGTRRFANGVSNGSQTASASNLSLPSVVVGDEDGSMSRPVDGSETNSELGSGSAGVTGRGENGYRGPEDSSRNDDQPEGSKSLPSEPVSLRDNLPSQVESDPLANLDNDEQQVLHSRSVSNEELFVKDAFLVFRALCKLTMKPLLTQSEKDPKSQDVRNKVLSLRLVLAIVKNHTRVFTSPAIVIPSSSSSETTPFLQATKQYLCLSLSRNALSPVTSVFELSVDLFWCMLSGLRAQLKIFIPILEMRHASAQQKLCLMEAYLQLCQDPQALVDIYVNYDCDDETLENIYERLMGVIARMGQVPYAPFKKGSESDAKASNVDAENRLRRAAITCVVRTLQSLVSWSNRAASDDQDETRRKSAISVVNGEPSSRDSISSLSGVVPPEPTSASLGDEELEKFESARQRKASLLEGIRKFNFKPKRGIEYLIKEGFVKSQEPADVARFLLETDGLNKAMIGEYLGEGDEYNVSVMHAFVDRMNFADLGFTDAVRVFLQAFRLPGEAQKIDRFMLKFAERYIAGNPSTAFANADTAYVLAFSVIMLNTDAHNKNFKQKRMTKQEFLRNNRGINDGTDLPEDLLGAIYDDIQSNEIKMKDEIETLTATASAGGLASTLAGVGRDAQREAYVAQSETMATKTEALFKTLLRQRKRGGKSAEQYHSAIHLQLVKPMFEAVWMPFLAAISGPFHESDDTEFVLLCLEGFKHAIRIAGQFAIELAQNAFVSTLAKFTYLSNIAEMKAKHVEAIKTLLDIAISDGNNLRKSWKDVLTCVSQLERMQLISSGMDVPDLHRRETNAKSKQSRKRMPADDVAEEGRSSQVTVAADMVFSQTKNLSGAAIVDFAQALSEISWEEIQSSTSANVAPRMFSLQKLVEISYYNMSRIRLEWSNIWAILGSHFNRVCCHNNAKVSFFALDALRQLSMRFLEKEELAHFRFQKDFLQPFEYTMIHNQNADAREMVLQCLQQMLKARVSNLRSGWRTMFQVFAAASRVLTERVVTYAFEIVTEIYRRYFDLVVKYGSLPDFSMCVTAFCRVQKFQKISLQAIDMLRHMVKRIMESPEYGSIKTESSEEKLQSGENNTHLWFPMLFSFYDILMTAEDLEVRRLALDSLFNTLAVHGTKFDGDFWDVVSEKVLFPIFAILNNPDSIQRFSNQEHMSVWLSTTMVSALRNLVDLYTQYFDILRRSLAGILNLLCACICQENDTLARIGTSCFQQLLENNVLKLTPDDWEKVITAFVRLFHTTTADQLFEEALRSTADDTAESGTPAREEPSGLIAPAPLSTAGDDISAPRQKLQPMSEVERRRIFKQIIVKCVLQLLLIESTNELLQNDDVYATIPPDHLLRLMGVLNDSYEFARKFNADKDLRMDLWRVGFMKQLPNLLKQESSSASTLVTVLLRMYRDPRSGHRASREGVLERLIPLGTYIIEDFNAIDPESQPRNITAWTPVVTEIVTGLCTLEDGDFKQHLPRLYSLVTDMLSREMASELWNAVRRFYVRTGIVQGLMKEVV